VFVQDCIKGMHGITLNEARAIMTMRGLTCAWWRDVGHISPVEIDQRLTDWELDLHLHWFDEKHPTRGGLVKRQTPFISLTAGQVERDKYEAENATYPAHMVALDFATDFGKLVGDCFLFYCWVMVGMRPNVPIRHLAEEVRELNTYTRYSPYHWEGEIVAKIDVPVCQIEKFEHYEYSEDRYGLAEPRLIGIHHNTKNYIDPHEVTNYRPTLK
jgi:hypothetical protein